VNPRFGEPAAIPGAAPSFAVAVQARVLLGVDPALVTARDMATAAGAALAGRLAGLYGNPVDSVLARSADLSLTDSQTVRLEGIADTLASRNAEAAMAMQRELFRRAPGSQADAAARAMRGVAALRANVAWALREVRGVLTPAQWEALPPSWRDPRAAPRLPSPGPPG
jgi:hypothetical protein